MSTINVKFFKFEAYRFGNLIWSQMIPSSMWEVVLFGWCSLENNSYDILITLPDGKVLNPIQSLGSQEDSKTIFNQSITSYLNQSAVQIASDDGMQI